MRKLIITSVLVAFFAAGMTLSAQERRDDYLGLPGDNLNLYAVMRLFQDSKTLEEFERNLNDPKSNINNLDLNGDNMVDYIKVFDDVDGSVHNIVMQVAVGPRENQDVAVFTVQRFNNGQVQIQLTGDEQLYGKNYIVEPIFDNETRQETPNPGYTGTNKQVQTVTYIRTTPVEIATWPLVRFMYMPTYTVWHSSWYWGYYPNYWHAWTPFSYHYYYGYHYHWYNDYYARYRRWDTHRYDRWNDFYYHDKRAFSSDVNHRIEVGTYKTTYSHPDQRKQGEEMFAKNHPEQYRKSTMNAGQGNSDRRGDNNIRKAENPSVNRNVTTRRTTTTVTNRSVSNPSVNPNTEQARKSSTTVTNNRTVVTHPVEKSNTNAGRSSTTQVNRTVTNSGNRQNAAGSNSNPVQQKSTTIKSSGRKSTDKAAPANSTKKENNSKESGSNDPNRRR